MVNLNTVYDCQGQGLQSRALSLDVDLEQWLSSIFFHEIPEFVITDDTVGCQTNNIRCQQ